MTTRIVFSPVAWLREFWIVPLIGVGYVWLTIRMGWSTHSPLGSYVAWCAGSYGYFVGAQVFRWLKAKRRAASSPSGSPEK